MRVYFAFVLVYANVAENSLADTRIAGRRGDHDALVSTRRELEQVAKKLRVFADQHG